MTPLVPVESGNGARVCIVTGPDGTEQCGGRADTAVLIHDARYGTTETFRCAAHPVSRDIDALLASQPGSWFHITRLAALEAAPVTRSCAHSAEDAPYGVIGCCAVTS